MKTAAAYIRVSTEDQVEYSPASQLERIREYAKRNDYYLPDELIFADEGISGRSAAKRPEFNRMIGLAKQKPKPFDAILLWKYSRFARNREDSIVYKSMLRKQCGIDVISISENVGDDKMSVLIEAMIEAMDEYYSINLGEEVRRGMSEKVSRGEAVTIPSFGYRIEGGVYTPDPLTAPVLRSIFEDYANGKKLRAIAEELNGSGFRTRRGNCFQNRTIRYILGNPVYIGKIRWTPTGRAGSGPDEQCTLVSDGAHKPLIDKTLWDTVQQKLTREPKTKYMHTSLPKEPFMLQGLVRCSSCGSTLCRSAGGSLQCCAYARGSCKVSHSISLRKLNKLFLDGLEMASVFDEITLYASFIASKDHDPAKAINAQIERERAKLKRAKYAYENEAYTLEEYMESKLRTEARINALKSGLSDSTSNAVNEKLRALNGKAVNVVSALRSDVLSEAEKNAIVKSFLSKAVYCKPSGDLELYFYI